jgi:uncharacterized protein YfaS (alpha-2-macroglobulin family)
MSFAVEDFAPSRLDVSAKGDEQVPLRQDEVRAVNVMARFLYGAAGAALQTQGEGASARRSRPVPAVQGLQWGDQKDPFQEQFPTWRPRSPTPTAAPSSTCRRPRPRHAQPLEAAFLASVFEPGGRPVREGATFKVRTAPSYLGAKIDQGSPPAAPTRSSRSTSSPPTRWAAQAPGRRHLQPDQRELALRLVPAGRPLAVAAHQPRRGRAEGRAEHPAPGPARISRRLGWGDYRLELAGPDGAKSVIRFASGWGAPAKDADAPTWCRVTAGTGHYSQGDTVEITLEAALRRRGQIASQPTAGRLQDRRGRPEGDHGAPEVDRRLGRRGLRSWSAVIQPRDAVPSPKPAGRWASSTCRWSPRAAGSTWRWARRPSAVEAALTSPSPSRGVGFAGRAG